ncbi:hypothetical protein CDAR_434321 [Caerostris darwini]|uniref:Uncharacterized protein n=1 Tax=Caerostris darwini TaxID=1538125 RepID=A0AAV4UAI2_9ARAC|nr:hypothetical protein CDAR_434321 [Caerostris darwini]
MSRKQTQSTTNPFLSKHVENKHSSNPKRNWHQRQNRLQKSLMPTTSLPTTEQNNHPHPFPPIKRRWMINNSTRGGGVQHQPILQTITSQPCHERVWFKLYLLKYSSPTPHVLPLGGCPARSQKARSHQGERREDPRGKRQNFFDPFPAKRQK